MVRVKQIIWSHFASECLKEAFGYYKEVAGIDIARKIKSNIFIATKQLANNSLSGQVELSLMHLQEEHRYLVQGNFKIIYKVIADTVLITDLFDSRQDPVKINDPKRKTGGIQKK